MIMFVPVIAPLLYQIGESIVRSGRMLSGDSIFTTHKLKMNIAVDIYPKVRCFSRDV